MKAVESKAKALGKKSPAASRARKPAAAKDEEASSSTGAPAGEGLLGCVAALAGIWKCHSLWS